MASELNAHELERASTNRRPRGRSCREAKEELFNLRFQAATGQLESHAPVSAPVKT